MDIRDVQSRNTNPADERRGPRRVSPTAAARNASDRSTDRVTRSPRAHTLHEARRPALEVPEVRTERVEAVRDELAGGTLAVDQERIARALLEQGIVRI